MPVYRGREVTGFAQDDTGIDVRLSDGRPLRAAYLVGCDGGGSRIRTAAGIEFAGWDPAAVSLISSAGYQGGYAFIYSRGRWSGGRKIARSNSLSDVSCPATSYCVATGTAGQAGEVYTYSSGRWSRGHEMGRRQPPQAISCNSRSFCLAVTTPWNGAASYYATYSGGSWSVPRRVHTIDDGSLMSVACASARSCLAADNGGVAYTYTHGRWQPGHRIGGRDAAPSVSCTTSFFCVAVDEGWADVLSDRRWSGHTAIASADIRAISCAKGPFCMAVGAKAGRLPGLAAWARPKSR